MKWLFKAQRMKYCHGKNQAPSYQTLKKMDDSFPPRLTGGELLKKEIILENNGILSIPRTLHYFEPVQLMFSLLRDPDIMEHFVCYPQRKLTNCGKRIYDEVTSATWFENDFNNSKATENGVLKPGHLFVALTVFSDGSPIDKQMKHSEHPFLLTILNLTLEERKKVDAWQLVSLLPDIKERDLEKQMDTKKQVR
jgi:hypothetical protein